MFTPCCRTRPKTPPCYADWVDSDGGCLAANDFALKECVDRKTPRRRSWKRDAAAYEKNPDAWETKRLHQYEKGARKCLREQGVGYGCRKACMRMSRGDLADYMREDADDVRDSLIAYHTPASATLGFENVPDLPSLRKLFGNTAEGAELRGIFEDAESNDALSNQVNRSATNDRGRKWTKAAVRKVAQGIAEFTSLFDN